MSQGSKSNWNNLCSMEKGLWNMSLDYLGNVERLHRMWKYVGSLDTMCCFPSTIRPTCILYPVYLYYPHYYMYSVFCTTQTSQYLCPKHLHRSSFFSVPSNICRSHVESFLASSCCLLTFLAPLALVNVHREIFYH